MKFLIPILVATMLSTTNLLVAQNTKTITVTVVNATSDTGKIGYALYTKDNFMGEPIQGKREKIVNGKSTVVFENVVPGVYAVVCYHDKNNNKKMDFSDNGMPLEDYGASNNVMAFAPPSFKNAKFMLKDKDLKLEIKF
ncbi:DUF2141 domain-containing protein [Polaribacter batillariae]|uniref:DUF2141 domain-containing protein n=2 Tax=Polaribacter batillariae TaxID=2808900 RepID=A0ABX7T2H7_9FLAO|nr:DUF2141 domain-containing protein [Polaribacter batillariae]